MNRILISLGFLCCLMIGCQESDRVLLESIGEVEKETQAIESIIREMNAAWNASDVDSYSAFYADDAVEIAPNEPAEIGKDAIKVNIQQLFDTITSQDDISIETVKIRGGMAVAHVAYSSSITIKASGESAQSKGNWLCIFEKRSDIGWKVIYSIFSDESLVYPEESD